MKKAFTLIELLVVIAIIAILAAILFPVFAQAKAAAKSSASLSNAKQLNLGTQMYSADYDDTIVPATTWNTGNDQLTFGANMAFSTWGWTIAPYVKSADLYQDPSAPRVVVPASLANAANNYKLFALQYGLNYTFLTNYTSDSNGNMVMAPLSTTSLGAPAETVLLGAKYADSENKSGSTYGIAFPGGALSDASIDVVADCATIVPYCLDNWGTNGFHQGTLLLSEAAGGLTGGLSLRNASNAVVSFADGHAKSMKAGALAVGTNWTRTTTSANVHVTDVTRYMWDAQ